MKNFATIVFLVILHMLFSVESHASVIIDLQFNDYGNNPADRSDFNAFGGNYSLWDNNFQTAGGYLNVSMSSKALGRVGFNWIGEPLDASKSLTIESAFSMFDPGYDNFTRGTAFIESYDGANELSFYLTSSGIKVSTITGYETIAIDLAPINTYRISSNANSNAYQLFVNNALLYSWLAPSTTLNGFQLGVGGAEWDPTGPGVDAKFDFITLSQEVSSVPLPPTIALFLSGIIVLFSTKSIR